MYGGRSDGSLSCGSAAGVGCRLALEVAETQLGGFKVTVHNTAHI